MHHAVLRGIARDCRIRRAFHFTIIVLLACCTLALTGAPPVAAQDTKPGVMPTAPSAGKALVCIYRQSRAVGSAAHDHLYVNGVYVGTLLNGEYTWTEVPPGTVVIAGMAKMYYGPSVIMSTAAAVNQTRKEDERLRFEAEAGKIYYMKWTSGVAASGIKVTLEDTSVGAKEMSKLHPTKISEEKDKETQEQK